MATAYLTFHSVSECGFYKRSEEVKSFGNLADLLEDFKSWATADEKTLGDTCTYKPTETSHLLRTFCYDCKFDQATGDYLLITWNETSSFDGKVAHVSVDGPVGQTTVENTPIPERSIPGFPTYFWFLPALNAYATIRFNSSLNGNEGMKKLLKEFYAKASKYCVYEELQNPENADTFKILGYRPNPAEEQPPEPYFVRFQSAPQRKAATIEYIQGSRSRIRSVHRKNLVLQAGQPDSEDGQFFTKLFRKVGNLDPVSREEIHISYEMQMTPTEPELDAIITDWQLAENQINRTKWEDIGFEFSGEAQKIHWLSSSLVQVNPELTISPDDNGIVSSSLLFAELLQRVRPIAVRTITA